MAVYRVVSTQQKGLALDRRPFSPGAMKRGTGCPHCSVNVGLVTFSEPG